MKRTLITLLMVFGSFAIGFAFRSFLITVKPPIEMKKVTGIGGIFFKCQDPKNISAWYQKHLGIPAGPYGATFEWFEAADSTQKGQTQWTPFAQNTDYFAPSGKEFMINYRVADLEALVEQLKQEGVPLLDDIATYDYGKFVHLLDPEGNKIELWEPTEKA